MATTTITCKQCNYANEPERVYCHNCGAKLDRTLLPKEPEKKAEDLAKSQKRVAKLVNPATGFWVNWHRALFSTLASALSVAALIQMARPPDGVPKAPSKDDLLNAPQIMQDMEDSQMYTVPQKRQLTEPAINLYLANALRTRGDTSDDYFKFDRAFVNLGKDVIKVTTQLSAFNYPIYAGSSYTLSIAGGSWCPEMWEGIWAGSRCTPSSWSIAARPFSSCGRR